MSDTSTDLALTMKIGKLFRHEREELGLSLRQVAQATNISSSNINRIETGQLLKPSFSDILVLATYYHVPLASLSNPGKEVIRPEMEQRLMALDALCRAIAAQSADWEFEGFLGYLQSFAKYLDQAHGGRGPIPSETAVLRA